jgi:hypothetical protein
MADMMAARVEGASPRGEGGEVISLGDKQSDKHLSDRGRSTETSSLKAETTSERCACVDGPFCLKSNGGVPGYVLYPAGGDSLGFAPVLSKKVLLLPLILMHEDGMLSNKIQNPRIWVFTRTRSR